MMTTGMIGLLQVDTEPKLWVEFFLAFSRLEYALKRAGYLNRKQNWAEPDWKEFANEVGKLGGTDLDPVLQCCDYLRKNPPKRQVQVNGKLDWEERQASDCPVKDVIDSIRCVRNNLCHGGKFPGGPVEDPARDEKLIRDCLNVLKELLKLPKCKEVKKYFYEV